MSELFLADSASSVVFDHIEKDQRAWDLYNQWCEDHDLDPFAATFRYGGSNYVNLGEYLSYVAEQSNDYDKYPLFIAAGLCSQDAEWMDTWAPEYSAYAVNAIYYDYSYETFRAMDEEDLCTYLGDCFDAKVNPDNLDKYIDVYEYSYGTIFSDAGLSKGFVLAGE